MDAWDGFGLLGVVGIVAGVGAIYWPAAMILAGAGIIAIYFLRERARAAQQAPRR